MASFVCSVERFANEVLLSLLCSALTGGLGPVCAQMPNKASQYLKKRQICFEQEAAIIIQPFNLT